MRKFVSVVLAAGLLASLSACTTAPQLVSSCAASGNAALVTAKGAFGKDPEANFPTPIVAKKPEVAVVKGHDDTAVTSDDAVDLAVSIYDGKTGQVLQSQSGAITAVTLRLFVADGAFPFTEAMTCAGKGSRVVLTGTASQLFGKNSIGLDPDTSLVVVSDVESAFPAKATGVDQLPQAGYPAVVLAPNGRPGITFLSSDPVKGLGTEALKQGLGTTVKKNDAVIANITGVVWGGKSTFLSSWDNNGPTTVKAADLDASGDGLVPGLAKAIIGQKVGSQLVVVVPPDEGFATGQAPDGVAAGDTLVYVVDILGISQ